MKYDVIKWKNLLSYGNKLQEYKFKDGPNLVQIQGENGAGKSSIKEAITVSTYGRSAIRKTKDLPNWINRNAYTYVKFYTRKGDAIEIERGIDPNFAEIKINGVSYNLPDKRKIDDFVEDEILGISFNIFSNTISLSFDDFKSFVNLSASDKRKIIDPMFGIDVLSDMRSEVKDEIKDNRKSLDAIELNISKNKSLHENALNQLKDLRKKLNEAAENKTSEIEKNIKSKKKIMESHKSKFNEIKTKVDKLKKESEDFRDKIYNHKSTIKELASKILVYEDNKCPHCLSDLTQSAPQKIKKELEDKKKLESERLESINSEFTKLTNLIEPLIKDKDTEKDKFYEINSEIKSLQNELSKAQESVEDDQENSISEIIKNIKKEIRSSESECTVHRDNIELYEILDEALSDSGIKRSIIDKVIPTLNSRIKEISDRFNFKFNFEFDNDFNPVITHMGMEISSSSLSTGQRKKMNLIVLLSFIELIKLKHNQVNIMFLDEIFSGLDYKNVNLATEILREYSKKYSITIFVVSNDSLPEELFDEKISVSMPNHFSEISIKSNAIEPK